MPLVKTSAIVLKSRRWGDADRIVTCYTLRFGKIRAVARGARRMKSRLGGSIEPFVLCQMDLKSPAILFIGFLRWPCRSPFWHSGRI